MTLRTHNRVLPAFDPLLLFQSAKALAVPKFVFIPPQRRLHFAPKFTLNGASIPASKPMRKLKITTKTENEIATAFTTVFAKFQPIPEAKDVTQEDRLAPYRKEIMKQRKRGLSWKQIAEGMRDPMIGETVSERILKSVFEPKKPIPPPVPAKPARPHLVLDPLTGQRIT